MQVFLLLLRYHSMIMFIVQSIEAAIPDGDPAAPTGPQKLDIALKRLIQLDASLSDKVPQLTQAISVVKGIVNDVKAVKGKAPA